MQVGTRAHVVRSSIFEERVIFCVSSKMQLHTAVSVGLHILSFCHNFDRNILTCQNIQILNCTRFSRICSKISKMITLCLPHQLSPNFHFSFPSKAEEEFVHSPHYPWEHRKSYFSTFDHAR